MTRAETLIAELSHAGFRLARLLLDGSKSTTALAQATGLTVRTTECVLQKLRKDGVLLWRNGNMWELYGPAEEWRAAFASARLE